MKLQGKRDVFAVLCNVTEIFTDALGQTKKVEDDYMTTKIPCFMQCDWNIYKTGEVKWNLVQKVACINSLKTTFNLKNIYS